MGAWIRANMVIAQELKMSLAEVIYGKKAVYENDKGISDKERTLWLALWQIEKEEQEAAQKEAEAKAKKEANRKPRR